MTNEFLFSVWAAVSTKSQVGEGKESIANQLQIGQDTGIAKGWQDTGLRYVVPGKSRTKYVDLSVAEREIPQLQEMLEDAKARRFHILILYDLNRLRDLLDPVEKTLGDYGVQIYSVSQPVDPLPPDDFDPYASDTNFIVGSAAKMVSRLQIADLRRKYRTNVPKRVLRGLYALKIPWGYIKPPGKEGSRQVVPIQVPAHIQTIREIKSLFLEGGHGYAKLQNILNERGYPTPDHRESWSRSEIKKILGNPFYAGKVYFGLRKTIRDARDNTVRLVKNPNPLIADGKHEAVYPWEDYIAIQIEMERRREMPRANVYPFSGLFRCGVCGKRITHREYFWWCRHGHGQHVKITAEKALQIVPVAIQKALLELPPSDTTTSMPYVEPIDLLDDLEKQRKLIQQRLERGIYNDDEAEAKIKQLEAQKKGLRDEKLHRLRQQKERDQFQAALRDVQAVLQLFPQWVVKDDPLEVNNQILRLCSSVTISLNHCVTVQLRGA